MFRRIGKFIEDIAETIKRERGNLKIIDHKTDSAIRLNVRQSDIIDEDSLSLLSPENPADTLVLNTLEDDAPDLIVKGETDHSPPPDFYSEDIVFEVTLPNARDNEGISREYELPIEMVTVKQEPIINGRSEIKEELADQFNLNNTWLKEDQFQLKCFNELNFQFLPAEYDALQVNSVVVEDVKTEFDSVQLQTLDSDFSENQERYFHEESVDFYGKISDYEMDFFPRIKETIAAAMRFPIKRPPVSKSGYQVEEIKRALSFIIERYGSRGKLNIVGIYKNVPIYSAEKLTFSRDKHLLFYYRKKENQTNDKTIKRKNTTSSRPFMLDVLVVKSREGKYHVGPIIRTV